MLTQTREVAAEPEEGGAGLVTARMFCGPDAVLPSAVQEFSGYNLRARWSVPRGPGVSTETRGTLECPLGIRRPLRNTGHAGVSFGYQAPPLRHGARWSIPWEPGVPTETQGALECLVGTWRPHPDTGRAGVPWGPGT